MIKQLLGWGGSTIWQPSLMVIGGGAIAVPFMTTSTSMLSTDINPFKLPLLALSFADF